MDLDLSIIVGSYNMRRQVEQTVMTLLPPYQENVDDIDYEIIVVDNGSTKENIPWPAIRRDARVSIIHTPPSLASKSPCAALNNAAGVSRGDVICMMIDGARMVTPNIISKSLSTIDSESIVDIRSYHLGSKSQARSILEGYTEEVEMKMLRDAGWPTDKYALLDISCLAGSNPRTPDGPCMESTCLFVPRLVWERIGGYNERFTYPGGGYANIDLFHRAVINSKNVYMPNGEGTFHQIHGGVSTNGGEKKGISSEWVKEYRALTKRYPGVNYKPVHI